MICKALYQSLKTVPLFEGLNQAELAFVGELFHPKTAPSASTLLLMTQPADIVYILLSGTVKVTTNRLSHKEVILALCGRNDLLGEVSVLDGLGHSANVVTLETCDMLWTDPSTFRECLRKLPTTAYNLARLEAQRLRRLSARTEAIAALDVQGRIAWQILEFSHLYGVSNPKGDVAIPLYLPQGILAGLLGSCRESVNKVLNFYQRNRLISISSDHRITIHQPPLLERYCR